MLIGLITLYFLFFNCIPEKKTRDMDVNVYDMEVKICQ